MSDLATQLNPEIVNMYNVDSIQKLNNGTINK